MSSSTPIQQALDAMLAILDAHLPAPVASLPNHTVSAVKVTERAVGLGDRRGTEAKATFPVLALKGIRLDAVVRFQLWAETPDELDALMNTLQTNLSAASSELRAAGFLQFGAETTELASRTSSPDAWRQSADYRVLYEFQYQEVDGAESLIAQIPISINDVFGESMLVSDEMVRWDNVEAPALEARRSGRRPFEVKSLSVLAFLPAAWDGSGVTMSSQVGGVIQNRSFSSVRAFHEAFELETDPVTLGEQAYLGGVLRFPIPGFPEPVILSAGSDFFRISYDALLFDSDAVVYVRALR